MHRNDHINNYTGRIRHILESGSHKNDRTVGRPPRLRHQSMVGIAPGVDISTLGEHDVWKRCEWALIQCSRDDNQYQHETQWRTRRLVPTLPNRVPP